MSRDPETIPPRRPDECLSDLALDQVLAGARESWPHVAGCVRCRGRLEALRRENQLPEAWLAAGIARTRRRLWRRRAGTVASLALAAALVVTFTRVSRPPPVGDAEQIKGDPVALGVYVRRGAGVVEAAVSPAAVAPGEQIRFEVTSARPGFLGIVGIDAAGAITPYVSAGARLKPIGRGRLLLDGSVLLDDTLGPERLIAVVCRDERATRELTDAARAALDKARGDPAAVGALELGCAQAPFLLQKSRR
jgi:hypothetical protein